MSEIASLSEVREQRSRRPRRIHVQAWTPGIDVPIRISAVRSAQTECREGRFDRASLLAEAMLCDDEFPSSLSRAIDEIVANPFSLTPISVNGKTNARSARIASKLGETLYRALSEETVSEAARWLMTIGVFVATVDWDTSVTPWAPTVRVLHPQYLELRAYETNWRGDYGKWIYHARDGELEVKPGDGNWILAGNRSTWASSAVCALGETWFGKRVTWRDWLRYNERHGLPILKAFVPGFIPDDEQTAFVRDVANSGTDTTVALPTYLNDNDAKFDLELLEAKDQAYETFQRTIERCDRKIQIYFLGGNSSAELTGVGSRAAAESGESVARRIAAARARRLATVFREQLLTPWTLWTIPGAKATEVPWPTWQIIAATDENRAATWEATARAMSAWGNAGFDVDNAAEIAEEMGLVVSERELVPVAPGAGGNPGPGQAPVPGSEEGAEAPVTGEPAETEPETEEAPLDATDHDLGSLLGNYRRLAIIGGPRTGKTTLAKRVTDRPVIHTDNYMGMAWDAVPGAVIAESRKSPSFIVEGVRAISALRKGLEVDAVVHLTAPKVRRKKGQIAMSKAHNAKVAGWKSNAPVFSESMTTTGPRYRRAR